MMICPYCSIATGTHLGVELKHGSPIGGTVLWVKEDCIGVTFDQPIDVLALLSSEDGPKPRMPRVEVDCPVSIRFKTAVHHARAVDISQGGAKIECRSSLPLGPEVVVSIAGLDPFLAIVRWRRRFLRNYLQPRASAGGAGGLASRSARRNSRGRVIIRRGLRSAMRPSTSRPSSAPGR